MEVAEADGCGAVLDWDLVFTVGCSGTLKVGFLLVVPDGRGLLPDEVDLEDGSDCWYVVGAGFFSQILLCSFVFVVCLERELDVDDLSFVVRLGRVEPVGLSLTVLDGFDFQRAIGCEAAGGVGVEVQIFGPLVVKWTGFCS